MRAIHDLMKDLNENRKKKKNYIIKESRKSN